MSFGAVTFQSVTFPNFNLLVMRELPHVKRWGRKYVSSESPTQKLVQAIPTWPWSLTGCWHLLSSRYQVPDHLVTAVNIILSLFSLATESRGEEQWELQVPWCSHILCSAASLCCLSSMPNPRWVHHMFPGMLLVCLQEGFFPPFKAPTHHKPLFISQNKTSQGRKVTLLYLQHERQSTTWAAAPAALLLVHPSGLEAQLYFKESCSFTSFTPSQNYQ